MKRAPARKKTAPKARLTQRQAEEKLIQALRRVLTHLPLRAFTAKASLVKDLGVDSLKVAELSIALEDVFDRPIFLAEVFAQVEEPSALTVGELAGFLARGDL